MKTQLEPAGGLVLLSAASAVIWTTVRTTGQTGGPPAIRTTAGAQGTASNPSVVDGGGARGRDAGPARLDRSFVRVNDMSDDEMRDIVAFLESLSDTVFDTTVPAQVPSGLPPGGFIQAATASARRRQEE